MYIYTIDSYSTINKEWNPIFLIVFATKWMKWETITLSEMSHSQKDEYHMLSLICAVWAKWTFSSLVNILKEQRFSFCFLFVCFFSTCWIILFSAGLRLWLQKEAENNVIVNIKRKIRQVGERRLGAWAEGRVGWQVLCC